MNITYAGIPSYTITKNCITVVFPYEGKPLTISSNPQDIYGKAVRAIQEQNWSALRLIMDTSANVKKFLGNSIVLVDGVCFFKGKQVKNIVASKIKDFWNEGLPVDSLIKFLENCLQNPNQKAVEDLYLFIERNTFTISEDGCFIAWKRVDNDFKSFHANVDGTKNLNFPGNTIFMDRKKCNSDRNVTCSTGLHFCSFDYLPHYYGGTGKVVLVKVNPRDVVAIPFDYNNAKGRCCEYYILSEVETNDRIDVISNKTLFSTNKDGVKYYSKRDKKGRFV